MADNTSLNATSGGDAIRDIDRSLNAVPIAAKTQVVQLDAGGESAESLVSAANPLPVGVVQSAVAAPINVSEANATAAQSPDAPLNVSIVGDPNGDFAGVNLLEQLMDSGSGQAANVNIVSGIKVDPSKAIIISDAAQPINLSGAVNSTIIIDTTGYQSIQITTQTMAASLAASNDGITWNSMFGSYISTITGVPPQNISANAGYWFPCPARYFRLQITTAGTATAYLRSQPWSGSNVTNLALIMGNSALTAGLNGLLAVGGQAAAGAAVGGNPLPISGADSSSTTRRILTDSSGRLTIFPNLQTAPQPGSSIASPSVAQQGGAPSAQSAQNLPATLTQDQGAVEGMSRDELLLQILIELKIANRQRYNLVAALQSAQAYDPDDPDVMRADPSLFVLN